MPWTETVPAVPWKMPLPPVQAWGHPPAELLQVRLLALQVPLPPKEGAPGAQYWGCDGTQLTACASVAIPMTPIAVDKRSALRKRSVDEAGLRAARIACGAIKVGDPQMQPGIYATCPPPPTSSPLRPPRQVVGRNAS